jgi:hypothetical protein
VTDHTCPVDGPEVKNPRRTAIIAPLFTDLWLEIAGFRRNVRIVVGSARLQPHDRG